MRKLFFIAFFIILSSAQGQFIRNFSVYDTSYNAGKMRLVGISTSSAYVGTIYALNNLWYKDKTSFHFFNDNNQWKQMDKFGHAFTSFHEGKASLELMKWCGVQKKGWLILAGMSGFIFQLPIEIFDGYSPDYGASLGDVVANLTGSLLITGQYLAWDKTYIHPKFSYQVSPLAKAKLRPNTLGHSLNEHLLKDYNGQTYWFSTNLHPFLKNKNIPQWLCFSLGYGAENMLYGSPNDNSSNGYEAYRQWYLAPDIDFSRIKTNKKGLKVLFYFLNIVKVPLPTIELNKNGLKGHILYF